MTRQPWIRLALLLGGAALLAMATPMVEPLSTRISEHIVTCALWIAFAGVALLSLLPNSSEDEDGEPVCTRCLNVVPRFQHYCTRCGTAVGTLTPCLPFEYIPYYCEFFGRLWDAVWIQPGASVARRAGYLAVIFWFAPWLLLGLPWVPRKRNEYRKRHGVCADCGHRFSDPSESHCPACAAPRIRCPCGYDLTGNESGTCPECGRPFEPNEGAK